MNTFLKTNRLAAATFLVLALLLVSKSPVQAQLCANLPPGCVAWWQVEGNGTDIQGTNTATANSGATYAAGKVGQAFSLDGVDDYFSLPGTTSFDFGATDFTLEMWVNLAALDREQTFFAKSSGTYPADRGYSLEWAKTSPAGGTNLLRFLVRNTTSNELDLNATNSVQTNQWYHIAAVRAGVSSQLYLNGLLIGQQASTNALDTGTGGTAVIGRLSTGGRNLGGKLDEVRVFNRALSIAEIQSLYNAGTNGACLPGLPNITSQPASLTLFPGSNAVFYVTASGKLPLSCQWFFNNTNALAEGISATLTLTNVALTNGGLYSVYISNSIGAILSSNALLTVLDTNDTDLDGLPNYWELQYGLNPTNSLDATNHPAGDLLTYLEKHQHGLNPLTPDTDGDTLTDYQELFVHRTDPKKVDTDGDGLPDGWEVRYGLNPLLPNVGVFGGGGDGPLVVNTGQTNYTDAVQATVVGANPGGARVLNVSSTNGFHPNDLVLIVALQDPNTDLNQSIAGRFEFARLTSVSNNTMILTGPLTNTFTVTGNQRVQALRVPQYSGVTVNGVLTCSPWDGTKGGVLAFLATRLNVGGGGHVTANGKGYRGGADYSAANVDGFQGESFTGSWGNRSTAINFGGGGGGGRSYQYAGNGGGGGGYATSGASGLVNPGNSSYPSPDGTTPGTGGSTYGSTNLLRIFLGSGGGSGGQDGDNPGDGNQNGGQGGAGGGALLVFCETLTNSGFLSAIGQDGSDTALEERGFGGGGSGGSLWLAFNQYDGNGGILATNGRGGGVGQGNAGGAGGVGRIQLSLQPGVVQPPSQPAAGFVTGPTNLPAILLTPLDHDGDGLTDVQEYQLGTDPTKVDTDGDEMPDAWEVRYGLNPTNAADAAVIPPGDRLTNLQKYRYGLNPLTPDTDSDGVSDYDELFVYGTNPLSQDTDGDSIPDGWEVQYGLNPAVNDGNLDRDLDGLTNLQEYNFTRTNTLGFVLSPTSRFSSTNGLTDYEIVTGNRSVQYSYDRDDRLLGAQYGNGLALYYQYDGNGNLLRQLTTTQDTSALPLVWRLVNGLTNGAAAHQDYGDADGDGWSNFQEWRAGSDPTTNTSQPDILGLPGTNIASLVLPFTPSNFVVGVGQLDGVDAEEIVFGADGNPGTNINFLFILSQRYSGWSTQRVDIGSFGITSIAVGQPANRPGVAIYLGLRDGGGTGRVAEVTQVGTNWTVTTIATATNSAAFVLGVRLTNDLFVSLAATNALDGALFSLAYNTNWSLSLIDTNTSHRGLGTLGLLKSDDTSSIGIRLLDNGGIRLGGVTLAEPAAINRLNWNGSSVRTGSPRATYTNLTSILYACIDDLNVPGRVGEGDEFVLAEYQVVGSQSRTNTLVRRQMQTSGMPSYGLAFVNYLNQANQLLFTAEPDGQVLAWQATGSSNPMQSQVFSAHHSGKGWHALSGIKLPQQGEGLIGLRVDPAAPNSCDVIFWPPQLELWKPTDVPQTAPIARILPTPNSGNGLAQVSVRLWDAEGNPSLPLLQYQLAGTTNWQDATLARVDGANWSFSTRVAAQPSGSDHTLEWNVAQDLGVATATNVFLRVRAKDLTLLGDWSEPVFYQVNGFTDRDEDGLSDAWEIAMFGNLSRTGAGDFDGDGFTDLQEYLADTNPTNAASYLRITGVSLVLGGLKVDWQGGVQATQYVQRRSGLGGANELWVNIHTSAPPTTVSGSYTDWLGTNTLQFYRIKASLSRTGADDFDGDGFTDFQEYLADTDPRDNTSYLRITGVSSVPGGVKLDWKGGVKATQYLQRSFGLGGANAWLNIYTAAPPTATSGSYTDWVGTNALQFYRLKANR